MGGFPKQQGDREQHSRDLDDLGHGVDAGVGGGAQLVHGHLAQGLDELHDAFAVQPLAAREDARQRRSG